MKQSTEIYLLSGDRCFSGLSKVKRVVTSLNVVVGVVGVVVDLVVVLVGIGSSSGNGVKPKCSNNGVRYYRYCHIYSKRNDLWPSRSNTYLSITLIYINALKKISFILYIYIYIYIFCNSLQPRSHWHLVQYANWGFKKINPPPTKFIFINWLPKGWTMHRYVLTHSSQLN